MKRFVASCGALAVLAVLALVPVIRADVKTTEKTTARMEGFIGSFFNRSAGGAEGITSTLAIKGNRMSRIDPNAGQIVDLSEQKVYSLDMKKKEYRVMTFAEMRAEIEKAKADAEKQMKDMKPEDRAQVQEAGKEIEFDADVKETGQRKSLLGYNTRQVILTITMHEKGKKIEESGGMVMTSDMWIAPKVAALDELVEFHMKFFKAVYGGVFTGQDMRQMASLSAMIPGFGSLSEKMATEGRKLQGTPIASTMTMETVKSAEQVKAASQQQQQPQGGGGIGGALARRIAGNRGNASDPRAKLMTTAHEYLTIATSASAEDVAIPVGFKEKK
jgi:hypothetical protein